ncbi:MAG: alpha/beta hydrolase, partial [Leptotrichiaceae bacterium]|nr:alpha/beta hydrolase [Leptotrichiaceae bacterium]
MLKKILLIVTVTVFSIIGRADETNVSKIAEDYPYKGNPIMSTVLGTPGEQWYKLKKPKGPQVKKFRTNKRIPSILRQWSEYEYGVWKQKKESPLILLISGTGSLYNSGLSMFIA